MKMDSIRFMIDSACAGRRPVIFGAASPLLSRLTEIFRAGTRRVHGKGHDQRRRDFIAVAALNSDRSSVEEAFYAGYMLQVNHRWYELGIILLG
jgi:hypothetical protein